jgi:hypothetical protein
MRSLVINHTPRKIRARSDVKVIAKKTGPGAWSESNDNRDEV